MIGLPLSQDVLKYEAKFALNLTTRKCICYGLGAAALLTIFFLLPKTLTFTVKATISACIGIPFFLWGAIEIFGTKPEKVLLPIIIDNFIAPCVRKNEIHFSEYDNKQRIIKTKKKKERAKISKEYKSIL